MNLAILQARMSSSRLPGKVLMPIVGKPMIQLHIDRLKQAKKIDHLIVATSNNADDNAIAELCQSIGVECYQGNLNNVLDRFYQATVSHSSNQPAKHIIRLTADCPLASASVIDDVVEQHISQQNDFTTNAVPHTFPDGLDVEVMSFKALKAAWQNATSDYQKEHVTPYITEHDITQQGGQFKIGHRISPVNLNNQRWSVDYPEDFELVKFVYQALYADNPQFDTDAIINLLAQNPAIFALNQQYVPINNMPYNYPQYNYPHYNYPQSKAYLKRAEKVIPLGSQTFSKSKLCYPQGATPHFITKGQGAKVWDLDGNQYIDFVSGLLAVNLGYKDPDVDAAVVEQLGCGVSFSLSHPLEAEVAELMVEMIPCAEMVRFGKTGSDATSAAIRLARAHTGRDKIAVCGYHGWHDWYIGSTTRDAGVPEDVKALTTKFNYNDIDSLQQILADNPSNIAAIILEPMNLEYPKDDFLAKVRKLATEHGAVLVFDEMITGFRYDLGGAQQLFGVTPDLATFGKSLANGFPLSAIVGRTDIMKLMEEIFFSGTFGGETLSLAAAKATLLKLKNHDVLSHTHKIGQIILDQLPALISKHQMHDYCYTCGHPSWSFLIFKANDKYPPDQLKSYMQQEQLAKGLMINGSHNLNFAHTEQDIDYLLQCYDEILPQLKTLIDNGELQSAMKGEFVKPVFKVR